MAKLALKSLNASARGKKSRRLSPLQREQSRKRDGVWRKDNIMGELMNNFIRWIKNIMHRVKLTCPWCGSKEYYIYDGTCWSLFECPNCHEAFDYHSDDKTVSNQYHRSRAEKEKLRSLGVVEDGNVWGIQTNIIIDYGNGYNSSPYVQTPTKPDREYCAHCHGVTKMDDRGNCCACGAPKGDKQ